MEFRCISIFKVVPAACFEQIFLKCLRDLLVFRGVAGLQRAVRWDSSVGAEVQRAMQAGAEEGDDAQVEQDSECQRSQRSQERGRA